ncbi:MAG: hypothetical protein ABEJ83_05275 [Candidatus Nanohaloarchaea archaeon]
MKILVGALMVMVGVFASIEFSANLVTLVTGGIGPLLILIGAFIVWLESDEWKLRREQKKQEQESIQQQFTAEQTGSQETEESVTQQQVKDAVSDQSEMHTCEVCGDSFDTERGLNIHKAQKHQ